MEARLMEVGEQPIPGQFYLPKNHELKIFRSMRYILNEEDEERIMVPSAIIPKGKPFLFVHSLLEMKEPKQLKFVWFMVIFGEHTGVVFNGQVPFHQFLLKGIEEQ